MPDTPRIAPATGWVCQIAWACVRLSCERYPFRVIDLGSHKMLQKSRHLSALGSSLGAHKSVQFSRRGQTSTLPS